MARHEATTPVAPQNPTSEDSRAADRQRLIDKRREGQAKKTVRIAARLLRMAGKTEDRTTTGWEDEFLNDVKDRVEKYGAAFKDPEKGNTGNALSFKQTFKIREIGRAIKRREEKSTGGGRRFGR
jgi:hypothetical protein